MNSPRIEPKPIGLAICPTCRAETRAGDCGLCRTCDADFLASPQDVPSVLPFRCATCRDNGVIELPGGQMRECACVPVEAAPTAQELLAAGIPPRYVDDIEISVQVWKRHKTTNRNPLATRMLHGPPSTGKTTCAVGILREARMKRSLVRFVVLPELQEDRRDALDRKLPVPGGDLSRFPGLLVLDDLAREPRMGPWWEEFLTDLIGSRYNAKLPTVFTTNHELPELAIRLSPHMTDRIYEFCSRGQLLEPMKGKNWRKG